MKEITGRHVAAMFVSGFGIIIAVNFALAWSAVQTFPGLEVTNSYVASQSFDADRARQLALDWDVSTELNGDTLVLTILKNGRPVVPDIVSAIFGRAASVAADQSLTFAFDGASFVAPVLVSEGNWNLRLFARAADGTVFRQRLVVEAAQ